MYPGTFKPVPFKPVPFKPVPFKPVPFKPVPFKPVPFKPAFLNLSLLKVVVPENVPLVVFFGSVDVLVYVKFTIFALIGLDGGYFVNKMKSLSFSGHSPVFYLLWFAECICEGLDAKMIHKYVCTVTYEYKDLF